MSNRNMLFNTMLKLLQEDGHSKEESVDLAYRSLMEERQFLSVFGPKEEDSVSKKPIFRNSGGQFRYTPTVPIVESICKGKPLICTDESSNPFRRINGTCNNVGGKWVQSGIL
jgi:hypothetical protein